MNNIIKNKYTLVNKISRSGFGTSWLAKDMELDKNYFIKHIELNKDFSEKKLDLIKNEAKVLKELNHKYIPKFIELIFENNDNKLNLYLVQEYIESQNLRQIIKNGKSFSEKAALNIAINITNILSYLHNLNPSIIHRDIKPDNILITEKGDVYLVDFGAVKEVLLKENFSEIGLSTIVGTQGYMPIEQFEGRTLPSSDIYSLGLTLVYILSNKEIFQIEKDGLSLKFKKYVNISSNFYYVISKMIESDYKKRFKNVEELKFSLEALLNGEKLYLENSFFNNQNIEIYEQIENYISKDEEIIWFDKANPTIFTINSFNIAMFILGLMLSSLSLFWTIGAIFTISLNINTLFVLLLGLPFILISIGLLMSPLNYYRNLRNTGYIITNKRIIKIKSNKLSNSYRFKIPMKEVIQTYSKNMLSNYLIESKEKKNGKGDIIFYTNNLNDDNSFFKTIHLKMTNINNVRKVKKIIVDLISEE